jgi:hypothetical protein
MPQAEQTNTTNTPDPVMQLAGWLNELHDAAGARPPSVDDADDILQLGEWTESVERLISYAVAESLEGALVQLALALESIDTIPTDLNEIRAERLRLGRLVRSAMRVVYASVGTEMSVATRRLAQRSRHDRPQDLGESSRDVDTGSAGRARYRDRLIIATTHRSPSVRRRAFYS